MNPGTVPAEVDSPRRRVLLPAAARSESVQGGRGWDTGPVTRKLITGVCPRSQMAGYYQQQQVAYTQQEREDQYASRLEPNPNRVGSGYVNYGPQVRNQSAAATNWQTGGAGGAAPAQVSE